MQASDGLLCLYCFVVSPKDPITPCCPRCGSQDRPVDTAILRATEAQRQSIVSNTEELSHATIRS